MYFRPHYDHEAGEFDLEDRKTPVCPWCGCMNHEWYELEWQGDADQRPVACNSCDKDYICTLRVTYSFSSEKPESNGDKDEPAHPE